MPDLPKPIKDMLAQLGISQKSMQRVKFGGIVGKVALIALAGLAATVTVAKFTTGTIQPICTIAVLLAVLLIIRWILDYAEKNPGPATLEGTELILWQHVTMAAAKGLPSPPVTPVIPDPVHPQPADDHRLDSGDKQEPA